MIRVGVAGWDYPDWSGTVYPSRSARGFDRLAYLARFVDVVEVNSSFYRPLDSRLASSWIRRTAARSGFRFTAKAHRSWTHEHSEDLAGAVRACLDGLAPLREADVLGAILVQFPQSFHRTPHAFVRLQRLLRLARGWPLVVEVRHASWDSDQAAEWIGEHGAGWCVVDQPAVGHATAPARPRVTSAVGYLRLHGRNADDWFRSDAGRDARYDYMYTREELGSLADAARQMARSASETFVIQNNHFRGQALANALQMKHLLEGNRIPAPTALVAAYPELAAVADDEAEPGRLF